MEIATLVVPINNQLDFGKSSIFTSKRTDPFTNFKVFFWGKNATTYFGIPRGGKIRVSMHFIVLFYRVGRRYMVCISTSLTFIANIAMPFSTSVFMFSVCRFFDGFCGNCLYMASFIIGKSFFFYLFNGIFC